MKKIVLLATLLVLNANATELMNFKATVDVKPKKSNKKSWDISGGAPDVYLKIDGKKLVIKQECRDSYRCQDITFVSNKKTFYIEIYYKDLASDGLIGKGECTVGSRCVLGRAVLQLSEGKPAKIVLADARENTSIFKKEIERLLHNITEAVRKQKQVDDAMLQELTEKIKRLHAYGEDISEKQRVLLKSIVHILKVNGENKDELVEILESYSRTSKITTT